MAGIANRLAGLLAAVLISVAACAPVAQVAGPADPDARAYHDQVEAQTRTVTLYDRFETRALLKATLLSDRFLTTWCREYARVRHLEVSPDTPCQAARDRFGDGVPVIVHLETPDPSQATLEPRDNLWSITLSNDLGVSVTPYRVERMHAPTVEDAYFFPYAVEFGKTYLLVFPIRPGWTPVSAESVSEGSKGDVEGEGASTPSERGGHTSGEGAAGPEDATSGPAHAQVEPEAAERDVRDGTGGDRRAPTPGVLEGHVVTLRLASVLGTAEMVWDQVSGPGDGR